MMGPALSKTCSSNFNVWFILEFYTTQILISTKSRFECISRLIKVIDSNDAWWKLEIKFIVVFTNNLQLLCPPHWHVCFSTNAAPSSVSFNSSTWLRPLSFPPLPLCLHLHYCTKCLPVFFLHSCTNWTHSYIWICYEANRLMEVKWASCCLDCQCKLSEAVLLLVTLMTGTLVGGCTVSIQTLARTCWNTSAKSTQCQSCMLTNANCSCEISSSQDMEYDDYCLLAFCAT
jgi:hypothetical protein